MTKKEQVTIRIIKELDDFLNTMKQTKSKKFLYGKTDRELFISATKEQLKNSVTAIEEGYKALGIEMDVTPYMKSNGLVNKFYLALTGGFFGKNSTKKFTINELALSTDEYGEIVIVYKKGNDEVGLLEHIYYNKGFRDDELSNMVGYPHVYCVAEREHMLDKDFSIKEDEENADQFTKCTIDEFKKLIEKYGDKTIIGYPYTDQEYINLTQSKNVEKFNTFYCEKGFESVRWVEIMSGVSLGYTFEFPYTDEKLSAIKIDNLLLESIGIYGDEVKEKIVNLDDFRSDENMDLIETIYTRVGLSNKNLYSFYRISDVFEDIEKQIKFGVITINK